jgi:NAD+ synthase (glutamine-hydrolysing)
VQAVMMPSRYTAQISLDDAAAQARRSACATARSRSRACSTRRSRRSREFAGRKRRHHRGEHPGALPRLLLMALSNKTGRMLLTTGNKSEMAVGYATLYGDMAGGFAPIKDCSKMLVYRLARYRNALSGAVIPRARHHAAAVAELRPTRRTRTRCRPTRCSMRSSRPSSKRTCRSREIVAAGYDARRRAPRADLRQAQRVQAAPGTGGIRVTPRASAATGAIRSPRAWAEWHGRPAEG